MMHYGRSLIQLYFYLLWSWSFAQRNAAIHSTAAHELEVAAGWERLEPRLRDGVVIPFFAFVVTEKINLVVKEIPNKCHVEKRRRKVIFLAA